MHAKSHIINQNQPQPFRCGLLSLRMRRMVAMRIDIIGIMHANSVDTMKIIIIELPSVAGSNELNNIPNILPSPTSNPNNTTINIPITNVPVIMKNIPTTIAAMRNNHFTISPNLDPIWLADSRKRSLLRYSLMFSIEGSMPCISSF